MLLEQTRTDIDLQQSTPGKRGLDLAPVELEISRIEIVAGCGCSPCACMICGGKYIPPPDDDSA